MSIKKNSIKNNNDYISNQMIISNIEESIHEFVGNKSTVDVGNSFCEWVLYNIFELREDEVIEATEIAGQFDNGIDAIFELNDDLYIMQSKYASSHNLDGLIRFKDDCKRLLTEVPVTNRQIVQEKCKEIRERYGHKDNINCIYITNEIFSEFEIIRINEMIKDFKQKNANLKLYYYDFNKIIEKIEEIKGLLPRDFREKKINLHIGKNFETNDTTIVTMVNLKDFADFVKLGGNLLFYSNIRNYLNKTKINKGITHTIENEPDKFWYYNNGVTIVCDDYFLQNNIISLKEPQIVNGCQTAKTIADYMNKYTKYELEVKNLNGHLLVKIIRTKRSADETEKKELRDNITRYTNSQNSVRGLDFYSLDEFQRDLHKKFHNYGYYYEIQRGAFITLDKKVKNIFKGIDELNYLVPENFKYVLPAKEMIQAFTAGIKQLPNVAYGRANELTPVGKKWEEIVNNETKQLPIEHFLYPFLVLKYAREKLGYKPKGERFKRSASLLYLSTYYLLLLMIFEEIDNKEYEKPEEIDVELYKKLFTHKELNEKCLNLTHNILEIYFEDSQIENYVGDNLKGFLQNQIKKDNPWAILKRKVKRTIEKEKYILEEVKKIIK